MSSNDIITTSVILLVLLGILMIYFGGFYAPKIMIPPILTGIGFFVIAWALNATNKRRRSGKF
jgi:heme O synthase-like polyprenyltransferase